MSLFEKVAAKLYFMKQKNILRKIEKNAKNVPSIGGSVENESNRPDKMCLSSHSTYHTCETRPLVP